MREMWLLQKNVSIRQMMMKCIYISCHNIPIDYFYLKILCL